MGKENVDSGETEIHGGDISRKRKPAASTRSRMQVFDMTALIVFASDMACWTLSGFWTMQDFACNSYLCTSSNVPFALAHKTAAPSRSRQPARTRNGEPS